MNLSDLSPKQLEQIKLLQRREMDRRREQDPVEFFPWHEVQRFCLDAPSMCEHDVRVMLIAGGNRGGKSKVGMGLYAELLRRNSAINDQLRTTDKYTGEIRAKNDRDPLTIWIVPPTLEKARQDWLSPQDQMGLKYWVGHLFLKHRETPDNLIYSRPPGVPPEEMYNEGGELIVEKCDKTLIKSQDQALMTFESSEVDAVFFDEEVLDEKKWGSCMMRIATTNGVLVMTYTPLKGLTWSHRRYWKHLVENGAAKQVMERGWIYDRPKDATVVCAQMGSKDNPRARQYAEEIERDPEMSDAEKASRLHGQYGYVEGTLIEDLSGLDVHDPAPRHAQYVVDFLPGQRAPGGTRIPGRIVRWYLVSDPNKSYGAVLAALDQDGNVFFVTEHLEYSWPDRKHAARFKEMEKRYATGPVERYADPGSAGAQSIVNMMDFGIYFNTMPKGAGSVSASVKALRGLAFVDSDHVHPITQQPGAPRLYFYRPGMVQRRKDALGRLVMESQTATQIGQARQTDNENAPPDTPHKDIRSKLDLFDCARYIAILVKGVVLHDEDDQPGRGSPKEDRLPSDASLRKRRKGSTVEVGLDQDFFVPTYTF